MMLSKTPIGMPKPGFLSKIPPGMRPPMNFLTKQGPQIRKVIGPVMGPVISRPTGSHIQRM
jgi:hypothetical protein